MSWKERLLRSLPLVATLAGTTTFIVTDEQWGLIIAIAASWLMESPIPGAVAVTREPNVSRETSDDTVTANVSRETITAPCVVMHGSAEPHVLGCDGWTSVLP